MSINLLSTVFIISNLLVAPAYLLMIFLPHAVLTRRVMQSLWSVAAPALLTVCLGFAFLFSDSAILSQFAHLLQSAASSGGFALYFSLIQALPPAALVMWLHAVAADLVMARWAYLESLDLKLPTLPTSLAILLMATNGPLGFLIYMVIRQLTLRRRAQTPATA
jgi:Domain of unknown function (DUF4281)